MSWGRERPFADLKDKTLVRVVKTDSHIIFHCLTGEVYKMHHSQDCCESVYLDDVNGELTDLIGSPIVMAEAITNSDIPGLDRDESYTWTFYKLATQKNYVTIRWYGSSNGYYSEQVDFDIVEPEVKKEDPKPEVKKDPLVVDRNQVVVELLREWIEYAAAKSNGTDGTWGIRYTKLVAKSLIQVGLSDGAWRK